MHPGGIADKVGNRFEALWLMYQLLKLIDGRAHRIEIELLGDEGAGFEFVVDDGQARTWHQCKRQTSASWTIGRLASDGVLSHFGRKLAGNPTDHCLFVSTDPASALKRLKEKQPAAATIEAFEASLSEKEGDHWQELQRHLGLDPAESLDWLRRSDFIAFPERELSATLDAALERWFDASPSVVRGLMRTWIEDDANFGRPLYRADLIDALAAGARIKRYELDASIPGKLDLANRSYDESYRPIGADLFDIDRAEVDTLYDAITDPEGPRMIALAGAAGMGKSVIVRKLLARLDGDPRAKLAIRLDQVAKVATLGQLGDATIEIADSPAVVLEQIGGRQPSILFIDQADAVSEMSGRASEIRAILLRLVNQARFYGHVTVVFSCRSFDLDNDHAFKALVNAPDSLRIDVGPLRWADDVMPVLTALGIGVGRAGAKIQALLCQPIGLAIAAELARAGPVDLSHVEHLSQLYDELLKLREREIRTRSQPSWSVYEALAAVAASMSKREDLAVPSMVLDRFPGAFDILQQSGLVVAHGPKLALMHESLFDYLHARAFVNEGHSLETFLLSSEQTLFRRTQVRQILSVARDHDRTTYLKDLDFILTDPRVRPHVRDLVIRWLQTIPDPTFAEWELVLAHDRSSEALPRHVGKVVFSNAGWIRLLDAHGIIADWLNASHDDDLRWALRAIETVAKDAEANAVAILRTFMTARPDKLHLLLQCFGWFQPDRPMPLLADMIIDTLEQCPVDDFAAIEDGPFRMADSWIKKAPDDAGRIFAAVLRIWYRHNDEGTPFGDDNHRLHGDFYHFGEFAEAHPALALASILPAMRTAMERMETGPGPPFEDRLWYMRSKDRGDGPHLVHFIDLVRGAFQRVAASDPSAATDLLGLLDPRRHMAALHFKLETVATNGVLAPLLEAELDNPGLFRAGWYGAPAYSAGKAISSAWQHLSAAARTAVENQILGLFPEHGDALRSFRRVKDPVEGDWSPQQRLLWARHSLECAGFSQWSLLRQLTAVSLSPSLQRRYRELERKFEGRTPEEPDGIRSGGVSSPIPPERAKRMNDAAWLRAMTTDWSKHRSWMHGFFRGDASDLARVLYEEAKENTDRFLALYWKIPADAPETFPRHILDAIAETEMDGAALDALLIELATRSPWPVPPSTKLRLIERRINLIGPVALAALCVLAATGDTQIPNPIQRGGKREPEPLYKQALEAGHELEWRGTQSNRGKALDLLAYLAWDDKSRFDTLAPLVDAHIGAPTSPALLAASARFLQVAVKHDPPRAAAWLGAIAKIEPLALAGGRGRGALVRLDIVAHDLAAPILRKLLADRTPRVRAFAAALVTLRAFENPDWAAERDAIVTGKPDMRAAAAHVYAGRVERDVRDGEINDRLVRFFNDRSKQVRHQAADVFRRLDTSAMALHADLYRGYLAAPSFDGERTYFLYRLEDAPAALDALVLELVELAAAKLSTQSDPGSGGYRLWEPLMRIYTSNAHNAAMRTRCLDIIDLLVAKSIYGTDKLQEATR